MKNDYKNRLCSLFGWSSEEFDEIYKAQNFRGIRINPLKADLDAVTGAFDFELKSTPFYKDSYYIPLSFEGIGNNPLHHAGAFYVQEPSASSVLTVVDAKRNEKILDLCAAPGGKSTGIGAELKGTGLLWSNEYVRKRAGALLSNIERMGIKNGVVSSFDSGYLCSQLEGFFDKVVVDAPCSGEGMWRHNPEVEKQWSENYVIECAGRQREILQNAANAVKPEGRLIYSTCTFSIEENEDTVIWFLENNPRFELEEIKADFGMGGISGDINIDSRVKRILPTMGGEGHFIASFRKNGGYEGKIEYISSNISSSNRALLEKMLKENFEAFDPGVFLEKGDYIYLIPQNTPFVKGDVLRYGLLIGEIKKNRIEPTHALFTAAGFRPKRVLNLDLKDSRVEAFLRGAEISADCADSGYISVRVEGCPLGFGKQSGGRITNKYPKGLRLL